MRKSDRTIGFFVICFLLLWFFLLGKVILGRDGGSKCSQSTERVRP